MYDQYPQLRAYTNGFNDDSFIFFNVTDYLLDFPEYAGYTATFIGMVTRSVGKIQTSSWF